MLNPVGHRISIRPDKPVDEEANKTLNRLNQAKTSGLVIPENVEENLISASRREQAGVDQGVVLAMGKTAYKDFGGDPWCSVGDYIAYAKNAGKLVTDPETGEDILILNDEDVICIIKEKV